MNLNDVISDCISLKLSGAATDIAIQCFGGNVINQDCPVLAIKVSSKETLLWMMQGATNINVYISENTFHVNALYEPNEHFPAARVYFMKSKDLFWFGHVGAYIEQHGMKLAPVNDVDFSKLIDDKGYVQRYNTWHERRKSDSRVFDGLLEGRLQNTTIDRGVWLSSDGRCLVCGQKTDRMATSTVWGKSGMMIGMQLCSIHEAESQKQSTLLNYISKHMGGTVMFSNTRPRTSNEMLEHTCEELKLNLECTIVKIEEDTVTALRKSGVTIILRLHSPSNYAYNILSPKGKHLSRVDSADHHKVLYGPDHVHSDLRKSKKNVVEASYTYGNVGLDMKLLLKLVQKAESGL